MKRGRQLNLFECFANNKRKREKAMDETMEETEETKKSRRREILAAAAEKRITFVSNSQVSESNKDTESSQEMPQSTQSTIGNNSSDLFPDDDDDIIRDVQLDICENSSNSDDASDNTQEELLKRWPTCCTDLPPLRPSSSHTITFHPHFIDGLAPRPYPDEYVDKWDSNHIRMPCSPNNKFPIENAVGEKVIGERWKLICSSLRQKITSSVELENAIMKYNSQYKGLWDFRGLHEFFSKYIEQPQRDYFFEIILPRTIDLALNLKRICTKPIPLLKTHMDHMLTISQKQIGCLLANAFFCTFPRRNSQSRSHGARCQGSEYASYPDINFNRLFGSTKNGIPHRNIAKLECLFNYFNRITAKEPCGAVTFQRKHHQLFPNWSIQTGSARQVVVRSNGVIETEGHGMLQVDFAHKIVGGGVLRRGCVQEEIRFIICPELILSRLFTECLSDSEALLITGVEQFNKYSGYADTFTWEGDYEDKTERDAWGRRYTQVVAIDAIPFRNTNDQYKVASMKRELNKAYVGFSDDSVPQSRLPAVATGNWGCGAYKGSPRLKFLIQLMAASQAGRDILYFTFGDKKLKSHLQEMYNFILEKRLTIGHIWSLLKEYCIVTMDAKKERRPDLYQYIYSVYAKSDTDAKNTHNTSDTRQTSTESSQDILDAIEETTSFFANKKNSSKWEVSESNNSEDMSTQINSNVSNMPSQDNSNNSIHENECHNSSLNSESGKNRSSNCLNVAAIFGDDDETEDESEDPDTSKT